MLLGRIIIAIITLFLAAVNNLAFTIKNCINVAILIITSEIIIMCAKMLMWELKNKKIMKNLKDKIAIVTGGTDGIGKAIAENLIKKGIRVVITGRNQEKLDKVEKEMNETITDDKMKVVAIKLDMNERLTDDIFENTFGFLDFGDVRMLFNNAGVSSEHPKNLTEEDRIDEIITVNNLNLVKMTKYFLQKTSHVKQQKFIINTGSKTADLPCAFLSVYTASKAFLKAFTLSLNSEMVGLNTHVEYIDTGFVATKMSKLKPSLFCPDTDSFAQNLLKYIGSNTITACYLPHGVSYTILSLFPSFILRYLIYMRNADVRKRALSKKSKKIE